MLKFARNHQTWDVEKWGKVLFLDEKNLDGPDGFQRFGNENSGESSIIVCGAFSYRRTIELQDVQGRQNGSGNFDIFERSLLFTERARLYREN